jgi:GR25 family glycosyltransferase involved in LPS biosynthesis
LEWDATQNSLYDKHIQPPMSKRLSPGEVGCAMSHISLWRELASSNNENATMLILEDDAVFYQQPRQDKNTPPRHRGQQSGSNARGGARQELEESAGGAGFVDAFSSLWSQVPKDWGIVYLGFSDRGDRKPVVNKKNNNDDGSCDPAADDVIIFRPTYGFHTHAYALSKVAACVLLSNLPVVGPLDVWLADNQWFGIDVYCGLVANEGWKGRGACLVSQDRSKSGGFKSDIDQSGRLHNSGMLSQS